MISYRDFPKIDAHFHSTSYHPVYEKIALEANLRYININTNANVFPPLDEQEKLARQYVHKDPNRFAYISSFNMNGWEHNQWHADTISAIRRSCELGAVGVKIWKNIGMEIINSSDNSYLMIDDPFFDPIFNFLVNNSIPVLTHLGEPKNCWLPLDEMTSDRNRNYYSNHPEFHAYLHPEIPNYELQIQARDRVLARFPTLTFVGAHFGSLEWSHKELSRRFDLYPNFYVDLSSRLGHMLLQSVSQYDAVREFFIKYDDRILYGTDAYNNPEKLTNALRNDWQFLTTDDECRSTEVSGVFKGIKLPEESLQKIYFDNATKVYNRLAFNR